MTEYNRKLADKFFNNQCSAAEAEQVLKWLDTPEGKEYLVEKMDADLNSFKDDTEADDDLEEHFPGFKKLNPEQHFGLILHEIEEIDRKGRLQRHKDHLGPILKIAASILVAAMTSLLVYTSGNLSEQEEVLAETVLSTDSEQQREVTLHDGTVVYLNENSAVTLSSGYMKENRNVHLTGEAFFDVAHNPELPFIIHTDYSEVEVLGTSFNMKSHVGSNLIEVAVIEGVVSFKDRREEGADRVILERGNYAYLDLVHGNIVTENFGVENYLAWKNKELVFREQSMDRVCVQLHRLYDVTCEFELESVRRRMLTANIPHEDLGNILSVIGSSLYLEYTFDTDSGSVLWQGNGE